MWPLLIGIQIICIISCQMNMTRKKSLGFVNLLLRNELSKKSVNVTELKNSKQEGYFNLV